MEYKGFIVRAFEREPGKWRASVQRPKVKPRRRRRTIVKVVTIIDEPEAPDALLTAFAVIDAGGIFSRQRVTDEKLWRIKRKRRTIHRPRHTRLTDSNI